MRLIEGEDIGGGRGGVKVKRLLTSGGFDRRLDINSATYTPRIITPIISLLTPYILYRTADQYATIRQ
jgi:hypothetical protein